LERRLFPDTELLAVLDSFLPVKILVPRRFHDIAMGREANGTVR
jgi:hypothetical protein